MRVCLINPPLSVHEFPHLALPLLKGYLVNHGIDCSIRDFNVEIMDDIINEGLVKVERYFYDRGMHIGYKSVKDQFSQARDVFKLKDRRGKEERAQKLINTYLRIAGSNIFDTCFKPDSLNKIKKSYDSENIDTNTNKIIRYIKSSILPYFKKNPYKVIGISVPFTSQIYYALIIGREIKKILPDCRVIFGGPQISLFWKIFIEYKPFRQSFDGLIYGMGEIAIKKYINAINGNGNFKMVPNLIYIDDEGNVIVNNEEKVTSMLDIPRPDFSDLPLDKYIFAKLPYQMSRGCYWSKCVFCSYRDNKGYITKQVEMVEEDFKQLHKEYDRHIFQFIDDAIHPKVLSRFAQTLLKDHMEIRYDAYLRLDEGFTSNVCQLLAKSGLKNVLFGFESANQRLLELMKKGNTPSNMLQVMKNMKNAGIQNILSCLIGFPTETHDEAWESIQFLKENREWYYWAYIVHFGLISDMCKDEELYGLSAINYSDLIRYDDTGFTALGYPYKTSIGMTIEESLKVIKEGRNELNITIFEDNFFS